MFDASSFPKITFPQVAAAVVAGVGPVLVLLGVHLSAAQDGAVNDLKVLALGLFGADAVVRVGRNVHAGLRSRVIPPPPTSVMGGAALVPDHDAERPQHPTIPEAEPKTPKARRKPAKKS